MKTNALFRMLVGVMVLVGLAAPCKAADYHVATAQELQNALTLAAASSVSNNIYLTNGYYTGNFNYNSVNVNELTLLAEPGVSNNQVSLDGGGLGRSLDISCTASPYVTVQGVTIIRNTGNGNTSSLRVIGGNTTFLFYNCQFLSPSNSYGIGLEVDSGINATLANCTIAGLRNGLSGQGVSISGVSSNVIVQNCTFATNDGTGIYISGGTTVAVTGSTFTANNGQGVSCSGTFVTVSSNSFTGNSGGGAQSSGTTVTLVGNTFTGNSGVFLGGGGGGAGCYGGTVTLIGNTFTGNYAGGVPQNNGGAGGGAYCSGPSETLSNNIFLGNYSAVAGGGLACGSAVLYGNTFTGNGSSSVGGGVYGGVEFYGNTFTSNFASSGGGIYFQGGYELIVSGSTFQGNTANSTGGGMYASTATIYLQDNLVVNNSVSTPSSQGGGIWVDASSTLDMINNTVFGNTSPGNGGGVAYVVTGTVELLNVYNNIIWGNLATANGGDVWLSGTGQQKVFDYNDADNIYGVWDIAQNDIDLSPQFFDPINGDYHTQSTSPCIAAGTTNAPELPTTDLEGNPRIINGSVDMGCYEFTTNVFHPADTNGAWTITLAEFNAYASAWKNGQNFTNAPNPVPANYMTRAGYLMTNGATYHNDGSDRPVNWKTGP